MEIQRWDTAEVAKRDRFAAWTEVLNATHLEWELVGTAKDFNALTTTRNIGGLKLIACRCDPCEGRRGPTQIGRSDESYIGILFILAGREVVRQMDHEELLNPGDFIVWDSTRAMQFRVVEPLQKFTILAPRSMVRRFLPNPDHFVAARVSGGESLGPLVGAYLRQLSTHLQSLEDKDLRLVLGTTLELVSAGIHAKCRDDESYRRDPFHDIQRFILQNLGDPELKPAYIAARNSISVRYLHKIFARRGLSVSRWIQQQRLERCKDELSTGLTAASITELAFAWGFNDSSHFSRCFRGRFGVPPRELRRASRTQGCDRI
jgi:AraC-like DNA-binding protein